MKRFYKETSNKLVDQKWKQFFSTVTKTKTFCRLDKN